MPLGLNSLLLNGFFKLPQTLFGKSVQPSWRFTVAFIPTTGLGIVSGKGPMPIIQPWHVMNITLPTYNFKKEVMMYGQIPRSFPVLDHSGFEVSVTFEEDELGTISYFINWLQKTIINNDGTYVAPLENRFGHIVVEVQDKNGIPIVYYIFKNCFYMASDPLTLDYGSSDSIKYNISFGVDQLKTYYTKYNPASLAVGAIAGVVRKKK